MDIQLLYRYLCTTSTAVNTGGDSLAGGALLCNYYVHLYNYDSLILRFTGPTTHRWKQKESPQGASLPNFEFRPWFVHIWLILPHHPTRAVHVIFQNSKFQNILAYPPCMYLGTHVVLRLYPDRWGSTASRSYSLFVDMWHMILKKSQIRRIFHCKSVPYL